jgi:prepilin-type N-terminal cleavage/methylation domain-containing protein
MNIRKQSGFTLIEIMVVIAILGILGATAVPVYRTWQQRAYGSEAAIMVKQIMDAQITYYLDRNKFYPEDNSTIEIYHDDLPGSENVNKIYDNLHIVVPTGHFLNYTFQPNNDEEFVLTIASQGGFELFKGTPLISCTLSKNGEIKSNIL